VRQWRSQWIVRVRRAVPGAWPDTEVTEHVADTPAQLRAFIQAARADPAVLGFPYEQRRELVGDEPDRCGHGHRYQQPGHPYPDVDRDWLRCSCGGHAVYRCRVYERGMRCDDVLVDPPLVYDCDAAPVEGASVNSAAAAPPTERPRPR
jgi:hypothetical protein